MIDYENIVGPQENIEEIKRWQLRAGIIKWETQDYRN
jgi:hypothetical protein